MVPVCDKRYHIYKRFRHFWAEIKKLWNYPLTILSCYVLAQWKVVFAKIETQGVKIIILQWWFMQLGRACAVINEQMMICLRNEEFNCLHY